MTGPRRLEDLVQQLIARLKPQARSLLVTIYGDSILPHGGNVWIGSLTRLVAPFGMNDRIVRTSIFRLTRDDWLAGSPIGRRSYYSPTETGRHRFEAATRRIYEPSGRPWDGQWTIVLTNLAQGGAEVRDSLRRELGWQGFGQYAPGVMLHPDPDPVSMRQILQDADVAEEVVVLRARADSWVAPDTLRAVVRSAWDLDRLATAYGEFLDTFRPVWRALDGADRFDPELCFVVRTLLIHDYRRVLLRDPMLPDELLPADWPGTAARALCRNLYRLVQAAAERHLMSVVETANGPLPDAGPAYLMRFGGLQLSQEAAS